MMKPLFRKAMLCGAVLLSARLSPGQVTVPLPLQPAGGWILNVPLHAGGVCKPQLNPMEILFVNVSTPAGAGVRMTSHSTQGICCTCIRRTKFFPLGKTLNTTQQAAHLKGWFNAARDAQDTYSVASFGIDLMKGGVRMLGRILVAEIRPNNNCATFPQIVLPRGALFDLDLHTLSPNTDFDEIVVHTMGYACGVTSPNLVDIADFTLVYF